MFAQATMKILALLAMPLSALAAPKMAISKRFDAAPFAPATPEQEAFDMCSTEEHHKGKLAHTADMLDCLEIGEWASENNGEWVLKATTDADDDCDWHILRAQGNCALLVKNTEPTSVGNKDVADLIEAIHLGDGIELGPIEEVGTFGGCQGGAKVSFWLRNPEPADCSK
ncbi:hypothetical protein E0Z10_g2616 [Xylaria hypoxylon]|uniref:Ecp2 effector protein-like domain-containing protein n=1 Tax=Xylaria hypoxylon TaxID=37992 RepID=A0A4Z0YQA5_9PEZI|nr:hypothetical protein E0Z10_g2616 [Xylaria hypoxylon]